MTVLILDRPAAPLGLDLAHPLVDDAPVIDDTEFELDMRVVESATRLVITTCDTSDGCGNTCSTSACSTNSADPF
ncbi:FxLD family lantipeptide [Actinokineospora baliensis]|uniref:FxLD family lanthipeptide n=1 Tax=Actinokineospora baliensis TaxID=547056 RepID=UPI00195CF57A|nr:FxLD family lanthipeptide [Actinokineospora baliensis]MBM7776002.1 FxLD family lantipeptide [Actinokineospora baliensis]